MASPSPSLIRELHTQILPAVLTQGQVGSPATRKLLFLPFLRGGFTLSFQTQPLDHSAAEPEAVCHAFQEKAEPVWGLLDGARSPEEGASSATSKVGAFPPGNTVEAWAAACSGRSGSTILTNWRNPTAWRGALGGSHRDWRGKHGGVVPPLPTPSGKFLVKMLAPGSRRFGGDKQDAWVVV